MPYHTKVQYSKTEITDNNIKIEHNGVRGCLQFLGVEEGIEIIHMCDLPGRTGLGSSSSFIVGLLKGLHALDGNDSISPKKLAKQAIKVERGILAEPGGYADQIFCSTNTGLSSIEIDMSGEFEIKPVSISREYADYFASCMTLVYIGDERESFKIAESLDRPETEYTKLKYKEIAHKAKDQLEKYNIFGLGGIAELLEETWLLKRSISPYISNDRIEECYQACIKAGSKAFKLLGAGGGGFGLNLVRPEEMTYFKEQVGYQCVDFRFDYGGSQIIYSNLEKQYARYDTTQR